MTRSTTALLLAALAFLGTLAGAIAVFLIQNDEIHRNARATRQTRVALHRANDSLAATRALARDGAQAKVALCALRRDRVGLARSQKTDLGRSVRFVREHPDGFLGFSHADLVQSLQGQQRVLRSTRRVIRVLHSLRCTSSNPPAG